MGLKYACQQLYTICEDSGKCGVLSTECHARCGAHAALELMVEHRISGLPVLDNNDRVVSLTVLASVFVQIFL